MALTLSVRANVRPLNGAVVRQYEAGGAVQVGDSVYIDANDKVQKARGDSNNTVRGRGVVVAGEGVPPGTSYASGQMVAVCVLGPISGFTGMDPKLSVYVDTATAGAVTQTKPTAGGTFALSIGYPLRSDVLMVAPQMTDPTSN
jgi:hypothetical protein